MAKCLVLVFLFAVAKKVIARSVLFDYIKNGLNVYKHQRPK